MGRGHRHRRSNGAHHATRSHVTRGQHPADVLQPNPPPHNLTPAPHRDSRHDPHSHRELPALSCHTDLLSRLLARDCSRRRRGRHNHHPVLRANRRHPRALHRPRPRAHAQPEDSDPCTAGSPSCPLAHPTRAHLRDGRCRRRSHSRSHRIDAVGAEGRGPRRRRPRHRLPGAAAAPHLVRRRRDELSVRVGGRRGPRRAREIPQLCRWCLAHRVRTHGTCPGPDCHWRPAAWLRVPEKPNAPARRLWLISLPARHGPLRLPPAEAPLRLPRARRLDPRPRPRPLRRPHLRHRHRPPSHQCRPYTAGRGPPRCHAGGPRTAPPRPRPVQSTASWVGPVPRAQRSAAAGRPQLPPRSEHCRAGARTRPYTAP